MSNKLGAFFNWLLRPTVWNDDNIPATEWEYRGIRRFVLPAHDILFAWFGIFGALKGIGSVERLTSVDWQIWWSAILGCAAIIALIGVIFPRLWAMEMVGKIVLIGCASVYIAQMLFRGWNNPGLQATAGLYIIFILAPIWRIGHLGFIAWKKGHGSHTAPIRGIEN